VLVSVVDVGRMFMLVLGEVMPVPMRVLARDGWFMLVSVVAIVVAMRMLMLEGMMDVRV